MKKILVVVVLAFAVGACQKASNLVIDNSRPINPDLTYFSGDSVDVANYINNDSTQLQLVDSFSVIVTPPQGFSYLNVSVTNDSGTTIASDRSSSITDSTVSGKVTVIPPSVYVGNLTYTFTAYNQVGTPGNTASSILRLYNSRNHPPVIDTINAPDSVQIQDSTAVLFTIYAKASDPDGLNDIKTVYFYTYKPDGSLSNNGNPFPMYDDGGASGSPADADSVAGDGIYTLTIQLPALAAPTPPALGTYVFKFYAKDRTGAVSQADEHNITVHK